MKMKTNAKLPWGFDKYENLVDADGERVVFVGAALATGNTETQKEVANTQLVVTAVNAHADLVAACKQAVMLCETLRRVAKEHKETKTAVMAQFGEGGVGESVLEFINAALRKAESI
jgi:hypothetical protein